jgi:hypothetical protein
VPAREVAEQPRKMQGSSCAPGGPRRRRAHRRSPR